MKTILLITACALALPACATITRGSTQSFSVETDPIGAQVSTSNGFSCDYTPCSFTMKRKHPFTVTVKKEGFETVNSSIQSNVSGGGGAAMAGNVLVGGIIGAGVDASTGAMNELSPNPLVLKLVPVESDAVPVPLEPESAEPISDDTTGS